MPPPTIVNILTVEVYFGGILQKNSSFNSTLVQLKGIIVPSAASGSSMFQFYLSSIKSVTIVKKVGFSYLFQFYLSSIKRFRQYVQIENYLHEPS